MRIDFIWFACHGDASKPYSAVVMHAACDVGCGGIDRFADVSFPDYLYARYEADSLHAVCRREQSALYFYNMSCRPIVSSRQCVSATCCRERIGACFICQYETCRVKGVNGSCKVKRATTIAIGGECTVNVTCFAYR